MQGTGYRLQGTRVQAIGHSVQGTLYRAGRARVVEEPGRGVYTAHRKEYWGGLLQGTVCRLQGTGYRGVGLPQGSLISLEGAHPSIIEG